jgi:hypothetical protein
MLQPEPLPLEATRLMVSRPEVRVSHQGKKIAGLPGHLGTSQIVESLMPDGVSPAKRAVIERLVTLWATNPKPDMA